MRTEGRTKAQNAFMSGAIRSHPEIHVQDHNNCYPPPRFPDRDPIGLATPKASSGEGDRPLGYPATADKASAGRFAQPERALVSACADEAQPKGQAQPQPSAAAAQSVEQKRASAAASAEGPQRLKAAHQDPSAAAAQAVLPEFAATAAEGLQPRELAQLVSSAAAADEPMQGALEQSGSAPASASAHEAQLGNVTLAQQQPNTAAAANERLQEACKQPKANEASAEPCVLPGMASPCAAAKGVEPCEQAQLELESEDRFSLSVSATDSEADSLLGDSAAANRKPGAKRSTTRRSRHMTCRNCGAHQTPQWRCGPEGPRTLCNACGVRYKKGRPLICTRPMQEACEQPTASEASAEPCVLPGMASACAAAKGAEPCEQAQPEPSTAAVAAPCMKTSEQPWWACPAPADRASHEQPGSASATPTQAQATQLSQLEPSAAAADEPMQQASEQPWWACPAPPEGYAREQNWEQAGTCTVEEPNAAARVERCREASAQPDSWGSPAEAEDAREHISEPPGPGALEILSRALAEGFERQRLDDIWSAEQLRTMGNLCMLGALLMPGSGIQFSQGQALAIGVAFEACGFRRASTEAILRRLELKADLPAMQQPAQLLHAGAAAEPGQQCPEAGQGGGSQTPGSTDSKQPAVGRKTAMKCQAAQRQKLGQLIGVGPGKEAKKPVPQQQPGPATDIGAHAGGQIIKSSARLATKSGPKYRSQQPHPGPIPGEVAVGQREAVMAMDKGRKQGAGQPKGSGLPRGRPRKQPPAPSSEKPQRVQNLDWEAEHAAQQAVAKRLRDTHAIPEGKPADFFRIRDARRLHKLHKRLRLQREREQAAGGAGQAGQHGPSLQSRPKPGSAAPNQAQQCEREAQAEAGQAEANRACDPYTFSEEPWVAPFEDGDAAAFLRHQHEREAGQAGQSRPSLQCRPRLGSADPKQALRCEQEVEAEASPLSEGTGICSSLDRSGQPPDPHESNRHVDYVRENHAQLLAARSEKVRPHMQTSYVGRFRAGTESPLGNSGQAGQAARTNSGQVCQDTGARYHKKSVYTPPEAFLLEDEALGEPLSPEHSLQPSLERAHKRAPSCSPGSSLFGKVPKRRRSTTVEAGAALLRCSEQTPAATPASATHGSSVHGSIHEQATAASQQIHVTEGAASAQQEDESLLASAGAETPRHCDGSEIPAAAPVDPAADSPAQALQNPAPPMRSLPEIPRAASGPQEQTPSQEPTQGTQSAASSHEACPEDEGLTVHGDPPAQDAPAVQVENVQQQQQEQGSMASHAVEAAAEAAGDITVYLSDKEDTDIDIVTVDPPEIRSSWLPSCPAGGQDGQAAQGIAPAVSGGPGSAPVSMPAQPSTPGVQPAISEGTPAAGAQQACNAVDAHPQEQAPSSAAAEQGMGQDSAGAANEGKIRSQSAEKPPVAIADKRKIRGEGGKLQTPCSIFHLRDDESVPMLELREVAKATGWAAFFKPKASTRDMCTLLWNKLEEKAQEEGISPYLISKRPQGYQVVGQGTKLSYLLRLEHIETLYLMSDEPERGVLGAICKDMWPGDYKAATQKLRAAASQGSAPEGSTAAGTSSVQLPAQPLAGTRTGNMLARRRSSRMQQAPDQAPAGAKTRSGVPGKKTPQLQQAQQAPDQPLEGAKTGNTPARRQSPRLQQPQAPDQDPAGAKTGSAPPRRLQHSQDIMEVPAEGGAPASANIGNVAAGKDHADGADTVDASDICCKETAASQPVAARTRSGAAVALQAEDAASAPQEAGAVRGHKRKRACLTAPCAFVDSDILELDAGHWVGGQTGQQAAGPAQQSKQGPGERGFEESEVEKHLRKGTTVLVNTGEDTDEDWDKLWSVGQITWVHKLKTEVDVTWLKPADSAESIWSAKWVPIKRKVWNEKKGQHEMKKWETYNVPSDTILWGAKLQKNRTFSLQNQELLSQAAAFVETEVGGQGH